VLQFSRDDATWLFDGKLQALLALLSQKGGEARVVGGAVRNALLNEPIHDIDIATTLLPQEVIRRASLAGFNAVATGIDFGTITVIIDHTGFEVTTLREDIKTDGRRAHVTFGQNWQADALRRDFTINALYCDAQGRIYDEVGGLEDIKTRQIRFIGDAQTRIREDYLRILRFFRFFAYYGRGRPDAAALKAAVALKEGVLQLSAERVWVELKKLLEAPDPTRSLLWMRQSGILTLLVPESEKWGIDSIHALIAGEKSGAFATHPLVRLMSMIPPDEARVRSLSARLKLSQKERKRLMDWATLEKIPPNCSPLALSQLIYRRGQQAVQDTLKLALATAQDKDAAVYTALLEKATNWHKPHFPFKGRDLMEAGITAGPEMGRILKALEEEWIEEGFPAQFHLKDKIKML